MAFLLGWKKDGDGLPEQNSPTAKPTAADQDGVALAGKFHLPVACMICSRISGCLFAPAAGVPPRPSKTFAVWASASSPGRAYVHPSPCMAAAAVPGESTAFAEAICGAVV
ncbi:MAG TPA: hypothetical protein VHG92_11475 [Afifellaceae bacterium]|nr:hypothetical protein [Afifellaceae bacterium]